MGHPSRFITTNTSHVISSIHKHRSIHPLTVCHFVYFYNAHRFGLLHNLDTPLPYDHTRQQYHDAILHANFLLPDGIALQVLWRRWYDIHLPNLNGTDFIPLLIDSLNKKHTNLVIYGASSDTIRCVHQFFATQPWRTTTYREGFTEHTPHTLLHGIDNSYPTLLLVGRGSPRQEIRIHKYSPQLAAHTSPILACSVGGLLDFLGGKEKRSPKWIRRINAEWAWRALRHPHKNFHKTLYSFTLLQYIMRSPTRNILTS